MNCMRPDSRISSNSQAARAEPAEPKILSADSNPRPGHEHQQPQYTVVHSSCSSPPKGQTDDTTRGRLALMLFVCVIDILLEGKHQSENPETTAEDHGKPCPQKSRDEETEIQEDI